MAAAVGSPLLTTYSRGPSARRPRCGCKLTRSRGGCRPGQPPAAGRRSWRRPGGRGQVWSKTQIRDISRCCRPLTGVPYLRFGPRTVGQAVTLLFDGEP